MNASNRQALINKTYKTLKKYYQPVAPPADRSLLEHLLYACCLENAKHESVDEVFARLEQNYFDWNEVRVTTIAELTEAMASLPDAAEASKRLKRTLQSVFETQYSFDLEFLKKQNLGKAMKELERYAGVTPFAVSYVAQNALGGHSIPVTGGAFRALVVLGVISESEAAKKRIPGMERAIPKSKGVEFASLLHQLGVDYAVTPFSPRVRSIIVEIEPDAKERLPKRGLKKDAEAEKDETAPMARETGSRAETASPSVTPQEAAVPKKPPATSSESDPTEPVHDESSEAEGDSTRKPKSATKRLSRKKPR